MSNIFGVDVESPLAELLQEKDEHTLYLLGDGFLVSLMDQETQYATTIHYYQDNPNLIGAKAADVTIFTSLHPYTSGDISTVVNTINIDLTQSHPQLRDLGSTQEWNKDYRRTGLQQHLEVLYNTLQELGLKI